MKKNDFLLTVRRQKTSGKKRKNRHFITLLILVSLFVPLALHAESNDNGNLNSLYQDGFTVKGKVVDNTGAPLPGVNVYDKADMSKGVITDFDGNYTITVSSKDVVLVFSFIGFDKQEIPVAGKNTINITLTEETKEMDEVVVVGYGVQKKINVTGSVDKINAEEIENRPVANVSSALQGVSPNLNISVTGSGGEPGSSKSLNIRGEGSLSGNDSPYVLVDGIPMDMNDVNPNDIESISVLKDAAASAIYGARAPYGVILITTKAGKKEQKLQVSASTNIGISSPMNVPHKPVSIDFAQTMNIAAENGGAAPVFSEDAINRINQYLNGEITTETILDPAQPNRWAQHGDANGNNDWLYIHLKNAVVTQKYDVNLRGGTKETSYYFSLGYYDEPGIFEFADVDFKRLSMSLNLKSQITQWMQFNTNVKFVRSIKDVPVGDGGNYYEKLLFSMYKEWSPNPLRNPDGHYSKTSRILNLDQSGQEITERNNLWMTLGLEIEPIKNWITKFNYNWNNPSQRWTRHDKTIYEWYPDGTKGILEYGTNKFLESYNNDKYHMLNAVSSYSKDIKKHSFTVLVGYEQELKNNRNMNGNKNTLITDNVPSISTAVGAFQVNDAMSHWATQGVFGRLTYSFRDTYMFEFNARYDGSSRFDLGKKWGFFPSGSVGYNISREKYWESMLKYVSSWKVRASYGSLGNQNVSNYLYIPIMPVYTNLGWIMGSARPDYTGTPGLTSTTLTWETSSTINIGTDFSFINNQLTSTIEWYKRVTKDMFGPANALPSTLGTTPPKENNAELETKGWEFSVGWRDQIKTFSYNVKFMISNSKSWVTKYNNPSKTLSTWYEGQRLGDIWGLTTDKIMKTQQDVDNMPDQSFYYSIWRTGDIAYIDINGDGQIDNGDWTVDNPGDFSIIGNSNSQYNYTIMAGIEWKGIDFSMFWQGVGKKDISFSGGDLIFFGITGEKFQTALFEPSLDYWRDPDETRMSPNTDPYYPRPYLTGEDGKNKKTQTRYTVSGRYIRLKNLSFGYSFDNNKLKKMGMSKLRFYFSAENLLTFTPLPKLFDPETASTGPWGKGTAYPLNQIFSLGINVTF
jgi:TonB-linked SusC/RagA family outer membrane protein